MNKDAARKYQKKIALIIAVTDVRKEEILLTLAQTFMKMSEHYVKARSARAVVRDIEQTSHRIFRHDKRAIDKRRQRRMARTKTIVRIDR